MDFQRTHTFFGSARTEKPKAPMPHWNARVLEYGANAHAKLLMAFFLATAPAEIRLPLGRVFRVHHFVDVLGTAMRAAGMISPTLALDEFIRGIFIRARTRHILNRGIVL